MTAWRVRIARAESYSPWHQFKKSGAVALNYLMSNPLCTSLNRENSFRLGSSSRLNFQTHCTATHNELSEWRPIHETWCKLQSLNCSPGQLDKCEDTSGGISDHVWSSWLTKWSYFWATILQLQNCSTFSAPLLASSAQKLETPEGFVVIPQIDSAYATQPSKSQAVTSDLGLHIAGSVSGTFEPNLSLCWLIILEWLCLRRNLEGWTYFAILPLV